MAFMTLIFPFWPRCCSIPITLINWYRHLRGQLDLSQLRKRKGNSRHAVRSLFGYPLLRVPSSINSLGKSRYSVPEGMVEVRGATAGNCSASCKLLHLGQGLFGRMDLSKLAPRPNSSRLTGLTYSAAPHCHCGGIGHSALQAAFMDSCDDEITSPLFEQLT
jgi:hypothetical protein